MRLDPNQYKWLVKVMRRAIGNAPYKSISEVCNETAIVNHVPILAALLLCQKYIDNNKEIEDDIHSMRTFYKYDEIEDINDVII